MDAAVTSKLVKIWTQWDDPEWTIKPLRFAPLAVFTLWAAFKYVLHIQSSIYWVLVIITLIPGGDYLYGLSLRIRASRRKS